MKREGRGEKKKGMRQQLGRRSEGILSKIYAEPASEICRLGTETTYRGVTVKRPGGGKQHDLLPSLRGCAFHLSQKIIIIIIKYKIL